ncbi:helix-turn-helix domain-containing protein [Mesorhizobium sp. BAC0120]|uniref:helix-turn-helix domain-containing protein n=1 Tax=Mesorhizobium sp. BAC0120 TaxID=3090670 RepID=UPI00298C0BDB|nr:helix-turn-helix domain-containing protein [Mesorhizobium sp. BAC0120]MDW6024233.1 helix-turn-helix domain-containing protein [Mesorhizobium sp. BAC0120]
MTRDFTTVNLPAEDQFDAWRHWFWPVLDVSPKTSVGHNFEASNKTWNLGGLVVSRVSAPPVFVTRTRANIARAPVDHWVLSCCKNGVTMIETRGAVLKASPGVPYLWSLGEASWSERTQVERIQILLPRDLFQDIGRQLDALRGSVLDTPMGIVLGEYMIALERWLSNTTPEVRPRMGVAVRNMIAACLAPSADQMEGAGEEMSSFLAERVRQAVRTHLRSPSLRPDVLCKMVGLSRSTLYRLFEHSGGVVHYIQRQRLLNAYDILSDPLSRRSILSISEELCFADASSFTRAFRHEFGRSPSEVRSAAAKGSPIPAASRAQPSPAAASFGDLLRTA